MMAKERRIGISGRRILAERTRLKLSRPALAKLAEVPVGYIRDLEKGEQEKPAADRALRIAEALGRPASYIVGTTPEEADSSAVPLAQPERRVSLFTLEELDWAASGKKLNGERSISVFDERENLAAFTLKATSLNREIPAESTCIVDLDDTAPSDGNIFVFRLNQRIDVRVYRDRNGPPRLEADSYDHFETLFIGPDDDFRILGRVIYFTGVPTRRH